MTQTKNDSELRKSVRVRIDTREMVEKVIYIAALYRPVLVGIAHPGSRKSPIHLDPGEVITLTSRK